ncbi:PQ-loop repeat-containing protein, partial [Salmonella enterica subsp. enterica serovar Typhimurium]|nr:PQ-loop repeat-containing protein [Salmonella enterica subsp. enterica serovar Typhimurium]
MIPVLPRITREAVSGASGTASLFVWIFAQTPQIYQNFRTKSVEGLSFVF